MCKLTDTKTYSLTLTIHQWFLLKSFFANHTSNCACKECRDLSELEGSINKQIKDQMGEGEDANKIKLP